MPRTDARVLFLVAHAHTAGGRQVVLCRANQQPNATTACACAPVTPNSARASREVAAGGLSRRRASKARHTTRDDEKKRDLFFLIVLREEFCFQSARNKYTEARRIGAGNRAPEVSDRKVYVGPSGPFAFHQAVVICSGATIRSGASLTLKLHDTFTHVGL